jgi:hypothetical protein
MRGGLERVHRNRAQTAAALLAYDRERPLPWHRLAVRAVGGQRLEDVRHREDARRARKVEGRQAAVVRTAWPGGSPSVMSSA